MNAKYGSMIMVIAAACLPAACTPTRVSDQVSLSVPKHWSNAAGDQAGEDRSSLTSWWKGFHDPMLDDLIAQALTANQDLKIATARVREANALVIMAESTLYPSIDFGTMGGREKSIDRIIPFPGSTGIELITPTGDAVTTGLNLKWEIDLFGGNQLTAEAAAAQSLGTVEGRRSLQVGLLAQVATNYLELRGVQRQTTLLNENIAVQRERLRLLEAFYRAGLATDLDVTRQKSLLHATESSVPLLTNVKTTLIHRLGVLLGKAPNHLEKRLSQAVPLPMALPKIPQLLPSSLLAQRPDIRRAQTEVSAAAASLGAAWADLLPKFVLSASGGFGALALGGFPSLAEGVYTLGSGLTAPIFNAGRIRAHITAADARLEQAATAYEKTFLIALEEVENAFVAYSSAMARRDRLTQADDEALRTLKQTDAFYQRGAMNLLSVFDAEQSRLAVADELAKSETAVLVSMVSLYRAFGGGWSEVMINHGPAS
jgi:NodT family efflux transporter outer membrane factor (OMF) lipoprotein